MLGVDLLDAHVRGLSAADVDAARPLARRYGFRPTTADTLRFAVELAAALSRSSADDGSIAGLPEGFTWPKRVRHKPDAIDRLLMKRGARRADADPNSPAASSEVP
jgi:hypothetical protein